MSEYTPITGELRDAMCQWGWVEKDGSITFSSSPTPPSIDAEQSLAISGSDFDRCCDAIDSMHAQLERENEALRSSAAHAYASGYEYAEQDRDGWVKLPVDADGEPICVGDVMVYADGNTCPLPVVALVPPAVFLTDDGPRYADMCRHQPDTWERILHDAMAYAELPTDMDMQLLVARCKKLAGES